MEDVTYVTVREAAEGGYRPLLVALRDLIARTIDEGCSPRDLVGLSRRLVDLAVELRALDVESRPALSVVSDEPFDPEAI